MKPLDNPSRTGARLGVGLGYMASPKSQDFPSDGGMTPVSPPVFHQFGYYPSSAGTTPLPADGLSSSKPTSKKSNKRRTPRIDPRKSYSSHSIPASLDSFISFPIKLRKQIKCHVQIVHRWISSTTHVQALVAAIPPVSTPYTLRSILGTVTHDICDRL